MRKTPEESATTAPGRLVVLCSGGGSNLAALLRAAEDPAYGARVVGVVTDRPGVGALDLARDAGVPTGVVSMKDFEDRDGWNDGVAAAVRAFRPDWVVLAGFMKILAPSFLRRYEGRVVNTHPALLPSFPGAHGVRDALAHGVKVTGCTVHLVDDGVDTGPILAQAAVPVHDGDHEADLHERIKQVERTLLADTVGRIAREGLQVVGRHVTIGR